MQGGVDHDGNVNARLNQGWSANNVTKVQAQARPTSTKLNFIVTNLTVVYIVLST